MYFTARVGYNGPPIGNHPSSYSLLKFRIQLLGYTAFASRGVLCIAQLSYFELIQTATELHVPEIHKSKTKTVT